MDAYHPNTVFSSIDRQGRYAFQAQPNMAVWNLAQLANALLPLINDNQDEAVRQATYALDGFGTHFSMEWMQLFRAKIGLTRQENGDEALITGLLARMASAQSDFTASFHALSQNKGADHIHEEGAWDSWAPDWQDRLSRETKDPVATMKAANPVIIARNHRVEQTIQAGLEDDFAPFHRLVDALKTPFDPAPQYLDLTQPPQNNERVLRTFCGT
jgi:uncharacterized protein YdiU (UPF0061 family)